MFTSYVQQSEAARHVLEIGVCAFVVGNLMIGNWVSTASSVALVLTALIHRIRVEERALDAGLGDRYRAFCAGRARLLPFGW